MIEYIRTRFAEELRKGICAHTFVRLSGIYKPHKAIFLMR